MVEEGLLQARSLRIGGQPFDGGDRAPRHLATGHKAGAQLFAVDQDRAGAAVAGVAADLGAGETEHVAQRVAQSVARIRVQRRRAAVEREADVQLAAVDPRQGFLGYAGHGPPSCVSSASRLRRIRATAASRR